MVQMMSLASPDSRPTMLIKAAKLWLERGHPEGILLILIILSELVASWIGLAHSAIRFVMCERIVAYSHEGMIAFTGFWDWAPLKKAAGQPHDHLEHVQPFSSFLSVIGRHILQKILIIRSISEKRFVI